MKKTALVTGANRGLGLAASKELAKLGYKVYMGCRNLEKYEELEAGLIADGLDVKFLKLDTNSVSDVRKTLDFISRHEGKLDLLVNNAGVFLDNVHNGQSESIMSADKVMVLKSIETNAMGPMQMIQSLVVLLEKSEDGRVVNVSSGMGSLSEMEARSTAYRMSKTALNVVTKIFSVELVEKNIKVNSICPGWCRTDMGGKSATRSSEEGVQGIIWLATCSDSPTGKFFRDKTELDW